MAPFLLKGATFFKNRATFLRKGATFWLMLLGEGSEGVGERGRLEWFVKRIYTFYTGFPRKGRGEGGVRGIFWFGTACAVLLGDGCPLWALTNRSKITTKKVGYKMIKMIEKVLGQVADYTLGTFDFDISESELVASYGYRARTA